MLTPSQEAGITRGQGGRGAVAAGECLRARDAPQEKAPVDTEMRQLIGPGGPSKRNKSCRSGSSVWAEEEEAEAEEASEQ